MPKYGKCESKLVEFQRKKTDGTFKWRKQESVEITVGD